jgi:hypothetical protein
MKKAYLLLWFVAYSFALRAQGVFNTKTTAALQKVIADYPHQFKNIRGDRVAEHARAVDYKSQVEIAGSVNCIITQYSANAKDQYSWTCELFQSSNFEQAKTSFKDLYSQISNTIIKIEGEKPFILNGKYDAPDGEKKATTVRFGFLPAPGVVQQLKVELTLQYTTTWKIVLTVYDQERQYEVAMQTENK